MFSLAAVQANGKAVSPPVYYHSLLADVMPPNGTKHFRELVVFHSELIYPEYVLAYQRFHGKQGPV